MAVLLAAITVEFGVTIVKPMPDENSVEFIGLLLF